jgi:Tol biopolymer transport system component
MPVGRRLGFMLPIAFALVAGTSIAACGGTEAQRAPEAAPAAGASPTDGGDVIVFERDVPGADGPDLYVVGPDGREPSLLTSPGGYPHWSPDGDQIAFQACLNPPDCSTAVALLDPSTGDVHGFSAPDPDLFTTCFVWAPSGRELACEGLSDAEPSRNGVYVIRASDGKGLRRMTTNSGGDDIPLAYSPDRSHLLLDRTDPSRGGPANHALFVTPIRGGRQPHRITPWGYTDDYASYSPDGRAIVFGTSGSLYRVSPEGRGLAKITLEMPGASAGNAFDVSFSPDGRRIIFSLGSPQPGIYMARLDGSAVEQLTASPTVDHHANWGAASSS